ncbi:MAG: glycosyltransferase family 4 protein [Spirochaetaceae bacterium]|nr:glycosyltransferase family 4 protein [Spirochaetaceae bacterium]
MTDPDSRLRLAVLQRVCPDYRVSLFSALSAAENVEMRLFIGGDMPHSKVRSARDLDRVPVTRLPTRFVRFGRRILPLHIGLVGELRRFRPSIILCEGESHFLGYLQAIYYRARYARATALIHWCFITLPGKSLTKRGALAAVKAHFRRHFDAFLVYSSFSKDCLTELGEDPHKVFVATNVGDVERYDKLSSALEATPAEARRKLGLPDRFTALYVGTLSVNKRPDLLIDLAAQSGPDRCSFVLAGDGELLEHLRTRVSTEGLSNVYLVGKVTEALPLYYRAADVLLIPGRGGIVISEAMAFGLPVVVHQADGTEYDLVRKGGTGGHVSGPALENFRIALEALRCDPERCEAMASASRQAVRSLWTTSNMVSQITRAAQYARSARN